MGREDSHGGAGEGHFLVHQGKKGHSFEGKGVPTMLRACLARAFTKKGECINGGKIPQERAKTNYHLAVADHLSEKKGGEIIQFNDPGEKKNSADMKQHLGKGKKKKGKQRGWPRGSAFDGPPAWLRQAKKKKKEHHIQRWR